MNEHQRGDGRVAVVSLDRARHERQRARSPDPNGRMLRMKEVVPVPTRQLADLEDLTRTRVWFEEQLVLLHVFSAHEERVPLTALQCSLGRDRIQPMTRIVSVLSPRQRALPSSSVAPG